ncbi:MAG: heat-inducible transcription repressor HrcA [Chloroflexi bacterium]|nr:heat-inducible transcription repressor HrcA [Chloroflexota bacterium]
MTLDGQETIPQPQEDEELSPRQKEILSIVVRTYINTAAPVGSTTIAENYLRGVSSATIRNELAYLEERGYLAQPHTSAGRLPTEKGYRYFVAQLMQDSELPLAEQRTIRHQFYQVRMDLEHWMRLTAAVLAHTSQAAALVTAPQTPQTRMKHVKLIAVSDTFALIVLVLHGGIVRQEMLPLATPMTQEGLEGIANKLNAILQGLNVAEMAQKLVALDPLEQIAMDKILDMMLAVERDRNVISYRDGLAQVLQQPEFSEPNRMRHVVQLWESAGLMEKMLAAMGHARGVQVIIGGEGEWEDMEGYSIVLAQYGDVERASGALGVLGPLRMPYRRAVSAVRYISEVLTELINDLYTS